jgi:predicted transcriptional regulator YdeE
MWFNPKLGAMEWLYAFPNGLKDTDGYEVFDFPGGLYAVAACNDDGPEIEKTNALIHQWIAHSKIFAEAADEAAPRYDMGHVITPRNAKEIMGNHQMDLFVPITYHKQ